MKTLICNELPSSKQITNFTKYSLPGYLNILAPPGGRGEASPLWVDVQKLCNMCVLSLSWNFFVSHDKYIARPSSKDTQTIQPGLGDFVL